MRGEVPVKRVFADHLRPVSRLTEQADPEEKRVGHFARKGALASTREKERCLKRSKQPGISTSARTLLFMFKPKET